MSRYASNVLPLFHQGIGQLLRQESLPRARRALKNHRLLQPESFKHLVNLGAFEEDALGKHVLDRVRLRRVFRARTWSRGILPPPVGEERVVLRLAMKDKPYQPCCVLVVFLEVPDGGTPGVEVPGACRGRRVPIHFHAPMGLVKDHCAISLGEYRGTSSNRTAACWRERLRHRTSYNPPWPAGSPWALMFPAPVAQPAARAGTGGSCPRRRYE